ncbi:MAG TPA: endonuclease/exonuclease/phosphatase family protein [Candidatus Methylomirabilis sp.]|nr:endonuclease/exonuclease/phosphatase family protein [Candidatus Methylomirabilis sp.]
MMRALLKRKLVLVGVLFSLLLAVSAEAQQPVPFKGNRTITVMTRNLYLGADLVPVLTAPPDEFPFRVAAAWATVQATNFPARAQVLADEIAVKQPDLIGLQEAELWRIQSPGDFLTGNTPATTVVFDFVELLLGALNARGLQYEVVAITTNFDIEAPSITPNFTFDDIRLTDRDVILARTDLKTADLKLSNVQVGNFVSKLFVLVGDLPVAVPRGWAAVDVKVRGKSFRFVTTHLEVFSPLVQVNQARELLKGPGATDLPVVFAGDFNSCASPPCLDQTPTYGNLIAAGLVDAWSLAGSGAGFTCCQAENLLNPISTLNERIDFVLFRGPFTVVDADLVGDTLADRTPSGLWPSDHAGVVTTLQFR